MLRRIDVSRRQWIKDVCVASIGTLLYQIASSKTPIVSMEKKTILLVSGWQDVNIGDIAHTPGLLHILETFLPNTEIILWKRSGFNKKVAGIYKKYFPNVKVIYGNVGNDREVENPDILQAFQKSDILIHGSGPFLVGADNIAVWLKYTEKPFGVFGCTLENPSEYHKDLLKKAAFIYTRETHSIQHLQRAGIEGEHIKFAPDATFFLNIRDDETAHSFLRKNGLEEKKFICAIPRLRYTPYHLIEPNRAGWSDDYIKFVEETNEKYKEEDHAKMREAIIHWVRETNNKVLVCPEMTYQVNIMDELLINPLPDDVKPYVIKRGYWMPDKAASIYSKAHSVLSFECHSPIIALRNNTPAIYLRQPQDTIKGQMYYDLGYHNNKWVFEIMDTKGSDITRSLMKIHKNYSEAVAKVKISNQEIWNIYNKALETVG